MPLWHLAQRAGDYFSLRSPNSKMFPSKLRDETVKKKKKNDGVRPRASRAAAHPRPRSTPLRPREGPIAASPAPVGDKHRAQHGAHWGMVWASHAVTCLTVQQCPRAPAVRPTSPHTSPHHHVPRAGSHCRDRRTAAVVQAWVSAVEVKQYFSLTGIFQKPRRVAVRAVTVAHTHTCTPKHLSASRAPWSFCQELLTSQGPCRQQPHCRWGGRNGAVSRDTVHAGEPTLSEAAACAQKLQQKPH